MQKKMQNTLELNFHVERVSKLQALMFQKTIAMRVPDLISGLALLSNEPLISMITAAHCMKNDPECLSHYFCPISIGHSIE